MSVTAAGTDDDRRAGGFIGGRLIKLDARNVFGRVALRARRAVCPEGNRRRLTRSLSRGLIQVLSEGGGEYADRKQEQSKICHYEFHHSAFAGSVPLAVLIRLLYGSRNIAIGNRSANPTVCINGEPLAEFKKIVNPRGCYIAIGWM